VFVPEDLVERGVHTAWLILGLIGVGLVAMAVVVADRLGRSYVRPMQQLRDVALSLRDGDRAARASRDGPAEVAEVADALNRLADRIDELIAAEREANADLSHRLRTPLTALRLDAERLAEPSERARVLDEVGALETAVDQLIRTARAAPAKSGGQADVVEAVRNRLAFWTVLASNQRRAVSVDLGDAAFVVPLGREQIEAAIDALIGNVFAHTPEGTAFHVGIEHGDTDSSAVLIVEDAGPGVDDAEAIARGRSGAGSTGLGLDIARRTAEAGGGELRVSPSPTGGTRVALVLLQSSDVSAQGVPSTQRTWISDSPDAARKLTSTDSGPELPTSTV